jgi:hypothetical protein
MTDTQTPALTEPTTRSALAFDAQDYAHFLAECDWTDAQKCAFIEELWKIVVGFVDLGFDLNPVQQAIDCRETLEEDSTAVLALRHLEHFESTHAAGSHQSAAARTDS